MTASTSTEERKTIKGWEAETGIQILDPDGFDRKDPYLYERLFTYEEFVDGAMYSTIRVEENGFEGKPAHTAPETWG